MLLLHVGLFDETRLQCCSPGIEQRQAVHLSSLSMTLHPAVNSDSEFDAGNPGFGGACLPLLAYEVVYASLLAEQGLLREATAYCASVQVAATVMSMVST